jgi:UDP-3-O-[3-hydroxymyristoyl] glucosamine N-acyltransferase
LANPKYSPQIAETRAGAIFLNENAAIDRTDIAVLRAKDAYVAYTLAMRLFFPTPKLRPFIHPTAVIDPSATVADNVEIHANAVVGANCVIAEGVRLMPNVTIYDGVKIGEGYDSTLKQLSSRKL